MQSFTQNMGIMNMNIILRDEYLERLKLLKDKQIIKIITGIRRCGKSTLLQQFRDYLYQSGVETSQIISLNFEDIDNEPLCEYHALYTYVKTRLHPNKRTYILLDEIQQVQSFQKAIDSLYVQKDVDIYITGSNAYMLSQELATLLSGRYIEIKMMPLSFKEYVSAMPETVAPNQLYKDYAIFGSFPYTLAFDKQPQLIIEYLHNLFNTIVLKDVITRNKIADSMLLDSVIRFLFDNIANPISSKSIADTLTSNGRKVDSRVVERFLSYLEESFILYKAPRFDIRGKQFLKTLGKYYLVDPGLRFMLLGNRKYDSGRVLENIIYLELVRRYQRVSIGKVDNLEVDFICESPSGLVYYQVAETTRDAQTLARELKPLQRIKDNYPKILLTLDEDPEIDYNGICKQNAITWLLQS